MASPFRIFRKHQRWLLATVGLLAMIAFTVPSAIFYGGGGGSRSNPVVVETQKYGNLKQDELSTRCRARQTLIRFVRAVHFAVRARRPGEIEPLQASERFLNAIGNASEKAVVNTWLFAKEAESQGMVVGDDTVIQFVRELTANSIPLEGSEDGPKSFSTILEETKLDELQLFDLLKYELSALRLQQMIQPSLPATLPKELWRDVQSSGTKVPLLNFQPQGAPPRQRWDYFMRLRRKAAIEVAPVQVKDFIDKKSSPSEKDLEDFFDEHKTAFANPKSPEPGFRQPHRIAVRYFKANLEEFAKRENIPDDEVYEAYEQNPQLKDLIDRLPASFFTQLAESQKPTDDTQGEEEGLKDPPVEKTDTEPSGDKATQKSDDPRPDGDETKAEPADDGESRQPDESSSAVPSSPFQFASYLQESTTGEGAAGEDPEQEKGEPEEKKGEPEEKTDEPREKEEETGEPKGDEDQKPSGPESKDPVAGPPETPVLEPPELPGPPKPKTREEIVSGGIGNFIRMQLATEKMKEVLNGLDDKMQKYRKTRNRYKTDKLRNKDVTPPEELDFEALANEHPGMTTCQTKLMSPLESIEDYDIGRSFLAPRQQHPFMVDAYLDSCQPYLPLRSTDMAGNQYLFWKDDDVEANVPKFEDVREQVLDTWRMVQARKPAMEEAGRLAEKAAKAGGSLAKALAGEKAGGEEEIGVTETSPFSWMTVGYVPMMMSPAPRPRRSAVEGVDMPGSEFMETVFQKLKPGDVGTAMNMPKTVAYVIRVREINPPKDLLWLLFEIDKYEKYSNLADNDIGKIINAYREEIAREAGLVRMRALDEPNRE